MATSTENPDVSLDTLLAGRFDRPSLRATLTGVRISDIADMTVDTFVGSLRQKDQLIGRAFWTVVLVPVRRAWQEWEGLCGQRTVVDLARSKLNGAVEAARKG